MGMEQEDMERYLDLRQTETDLDWFAAALVVQHLRQLLVHGGSAWGRPDDEEALHPHHLETFITRAAQTAQKAQHFEREWRDRQRSVLWIKKAWGLGQEQFRIALARATANQEEMEYFSLIDFAVDCYAHISAINTFPYSSLLQAWFINGYMLAWREHFLNDSVNE
jgi:hypothetical protein